MLIFLIPIIAAVAIAIALGVQQRSKSRRGEDTTDDSAQVFFTISRRK